MRRSTGFAERYTAYTSVLTLCKTVIIGGREV